MSSPISAASPSNREDRSKRKGRRVPAGPILLAVLGAIVLGATLVARHGPGGSPGWANAPPELRAILWPEPIPIGDFQLLDQREQPFGPAQLQGRWTFLFFGYLQCPDVCPTAMQILRDYRQALVAAQPGLEHQVVFVSVDPEYDAPAQIAAYLAFFDPAFIGLSGPEDALAGLAGPLAIKYYEHVDAQGRRSIDHTSSIMIVDPQGRVLGAFPPPQRPERMLELFGALRRHLRL
ncbi:MAG: SCO family protein [Gammaproteobacteria bacterium]